MTFVDPNQHMTFVDPNQQAPSVENIARILQERRSRYGDFSDNADAAQQLKVLFDRHIGDSAPRSKDGYTPPTNYMYEALDLIATKLSRILTGDPFYVDNWDDIAGYAKLVADRVRAKQAPTGAADDFPLSPVEPCSGCLDTTSTTTLVARASSMADISLMRDLDADQKQVLSWHPSHAVSVMQDLGGDIYSQCVACKVRELEPEAEAPCTATEDSKPRFNTETHFATVGPDER